jgi:hypothetical protein
MDMLVKNRSWTPRILVVKERRIALAARGTAEIDGQELESPEVQRLIADGSLFVLPEPEAEGGEASRSGEPPPAEASLEAPPGDRSEAGNPI